MQVSALEQCKKLSGQKSYFIELLQDMEAFHQGREECQHKAHAGRPIAATDYLHVQAVRVLLEEN